MTDQDENRPLSRRELRLREMAAAGLQTETGHAQSGLDQEQGNAVESAEPEFHIEIPLLDENGNPRSRRELRQLREQAIAELTAANAKVGHVDEAPSSDLGYNSELAETVAFDVLADDTEVSEAELSGEAPKVAATSEEAAFDAFLQQATAEEASLGKQEMFPDEPAEPESVGEVIDISGENVSSDDLAAEIEADVLIELEPDLEPENGVQTEPELVLQPELVLEPRSEDADLASDDVPDQVDPEIEEVVASESEQVVSAPVSASNGQTYSFPDITPLDDGQSIFDDPAIQVIGGAPAQRGSSLDNGHDFDELITRAVAQESATRTTNTSALILPVMPETDSLAGPLGETGELFITGSFDLPKSLSETGGHASLHDSIDAETFDELGFIEPTPTGAMAPVSASRAVSARANQGPLVAEATKDKSKMPVVLIATGGVLVLGATGLIIWAATSGLFG